MARLWSVTVAYTCIVLALAVTCARVGLRNIAEFRRVRARAPLVNAEILGVAAPRTTMPRGWPQPSTIDDRRIVAAYRDYARDRGESLALLGELLVLAAGAALGASIPSVVAGGWHAWPAALALVVGAFGVLLRRRAEQRWSDVAARFERRRADLHGSAAPTAVPARRPWLRGLRRR
jgi:hypothetical protein